MPTSLQDYCCEKILLETNKVLIMTISCPIQILNGGLAIGGFCYNKITKEPSPFYYVSLFEVSVLHPLERLGRKIIKCEKLKV